MMQATRPDERDPKPQSMTCMITKDTWQLPYIEIWQNLARKQHFEVHRVCFWKRAPTVTVHLDNKKKESDRNIPTN
jgi:hypothetical protein